jgi:hypothetical protein
MNRLYAALMFLIGTPMLFFPYVPNGDPAPFPQSIILTAPGYRFVGGAAVFVACAPDGTLRFSAYAKRPNGTEGHSVFVVDVPNARLIEREEYRPSRVIQGSISSGQPMTHCGVDNILSTNIHNPDTGQVFMQRGN